MRVKAIWGLGVALLMIFVVLFGLQYTYYNRIISLRKEQTRTLAKQALADVVQEVELRDLVRSINTQLRHPLRGQNTLMRTLREIARRDVLSADSGRLSEIPTSDGAIVYKSPLDTDIDTMVLSDEMLDLFFRKRSALDVYVLNNLYPTYRSDSIAQLISPRYLKENLRLALNARGVHEAYEVSICNARGQSIYSYMQPGMLRQSRTSEDVVIHRLFAGRETPGTLTPFLRLTLDFSPSESELWRFAVPGIISTVFVFALGIFAIWMVVRQLSFQTLKSSFINNMTHEFKTPVSSISLACQMLQDSRTIEIPEKRRRFVTIIEQETVRLRLLIDKVLQFSLFDGKVKQLELTTIDLNDILLKVADIYTVHAQKHGGGLELDLVADNTWVNANKDHMTNVFFNLLDNAVKYREPSRPLQLAVRSENSASHIRITIEDNGIGIPRESLKRIFERYYRVPTGYRHDVKGFGLGLSYVASVIKQMGGTIVAEQNPSGEGTRMIVELPLSDAFDS